MKYGKFVSSLSKLKQKIMKKITTILFALAVIGGVVISCKKYEEGPAMSLRTKKARMAGEWTVEKVLYNGTDVTSQYLPSGTTYKITIEKGGSWNDVMSSSGGSSTSKGTWEFVDKKENLKMVTEGSGDADGDTSVIVKLKNKELWIDSKSGSNTTRIQYKQ